MPPYAIVVAVESSFPYYTGGGSWVAGRTIDFRIQKIEESQYFHNRAIPFLMQNGYLQSVHGAERFTYLRDTEPRLYALVELIVDDPTLYRMIERMEIFQRAFRVQFIEGADIDFGCQAFDEVIKKYPVKVNEMSA